MLRLMPRVSPRGRANVFARVGHVYVRSDPTHPAAIGMSNATGKNTPTVAGKNGSGTVITNKLPSRPVTDTTAQTTLGRNIFCGSRNKKKGKQITSMSKFTHAPAKRWPTMRVATP